MATADGPRSGIVRGDGLLHPIPIGAVIVLLVNDHVLKAAWPGLVTGKLSDFAGLVFFPLFLQAIWEVARMRPSRPGDLRVGLAAVVATGLMFAAIKTVPVAADVYSVGLGWLQWLVGALPTAVTGGAIGAPHRVSVVLDVTDLVALPMLLVSYWLMVRRATASESP